MLRTSPFHRENYSRLILGVIIQFYQRCSDRFQDLVSVRSGQEQNLEPQLALAAQWAQRSELDTCMAELLTTSVSTMLNPSFIIDIFTGGQHRETTSAVSAGDAP